MKRKRQSKIISFSYVETRPEPKTQKFLFRISKKEKSLLESIAKQLKTNSSEVLRRAINEFIEKYRKK